MDCGGATACARCADTKACVVKSDCDSTQCQGSKCVRVVSFVSALSFPTGAEPFSVAVGDVNGDGKLDLVVANGGSNSVSVLVNNSP